MLAELSTDPPALRSHPDCFGSDASKTERECVFNERIRKPDFREKKHFLSQLNVINIITVSYIQNNFYEIMKTFFFDLTSSDP